MINHCTVTFLFLFLGHNEAKWGSEHFSMFMNIYSADKLCHLLMSLTKTCQYI